MKRLSTVFAAVMTAATSAVACAASGDAPRVDQAIEDAKRTYASVDLEASRRHYLRAVRDPSATARQRVEALRALATQDWRFFRDRAAANANLAAALDAAPDPDVAAAVQVQRGTMELEGGHAAAARTLALDALRDSREGETVRKAKLLYAKATIEDATRDGDKPSRLTQDLARSRLYLQEVLAEQPGQSEAAELLLALGVRLDDGPLVRRAFMSYMLFGDASAVTPLMRRPYDTFTRLAATWRGRPLAGDDRRALAQALAQARFHDLAAQVARTVRSPDAEMRALIAYDVFLRAVARVNQDHYPRVATGWRDYRASYDADIARPARELLQALGVAPPPASAGTSALQDALLAELRTRFGVEGYFGTTMNFYGLLAGHSVVDERRNITQHGQSGAFRYVSIDRLISRDFTSWYGTTNVGGWGSATTMYQVRAAYVAGPLTQLAWMTDATRRAKLLERIAALDTEDLARCTRDPHAEPKALPLKLKLQASERLRLKLHERGLQGTDFALAFVSGLMDMSVEATVFAHEGRHALDQLHFPAEFSGMGDDERELRAKFSEILFSPDPRLALTGSIFGGQLDESTGHGLANRRFREMLVGWMSAHAGEIVGLQPGRPLIMQADLLTDAQLLAFAREKDRMTPGTGPAPSTAGKP